MLPRFPYQVRRTLGLAISTIAVFLPAAANGCVGDCDANGEVTITELITGVQLALTSAPADTCPSLDVEGNGVAIDDLLMAVNNALNGCSPACACPAGYTCGSANGIAVCRAPSGVPLFDHVFVIVMENTSRDTIEHSSRTPYIHSLEAIGATSSAYRAVSYPSLPNYLAMTSGNTGNVACDCAPRGHNCSLLSCNPIFSDCGCEQRISNIADSLEGVGKNWKSYAEDMGTPCNLADGDTYAPHHVPFLYYTDIQTDEQRCSEHVVDYTQLNDDLVSSAAPAFVFIVPNVVHDMHDPFPPGSINLANGDAWLATEVPKILASTAYQQRGALFIVWDEPGLFDIFDSDENLPFILLSPLAKPAYVSGQAIDHYGLLATWEDGLGVSRLGHSISAAALNDFFPAQ